MLASETVILASGTVVLKESETVTRSYKNETLTEGPMTLAS